MSPPPDLADFTDRELVAWARTGHREEASRELLRRHQRRVQAFIHQLVHERELAEDLTQDTFVKVFDRLDTYNPEFSFSTWLYRIANNVAVSHLRRKRLETVSLDGSPNATTPEGAAAVPAALRSDSSSARRRARRLRPEIENAIKRLRGNHRRCFRLRYVEELSYEHIAQITGLPVGTVASYVTRARKQLKQMLGPLRDSSRQRSPGKPV